MKPCHLLLIASIGWSVPVESSIASIINGDFETGDLTGWTVSVFGGSPLISVVDLGGNNVAHFPTGDFATGPFIQTLEQSFVVDPGLPFLTLDFGLPELQPDPTGTGASPFLDAFVVAASSGAGTFELLLVDANGALADPFGTAPGAVFLGPPTNPSLDFSLSADLSLLLGPITLSFFVTNEDDGSQFNMLYLDNVVMTEEPVPAPGTLLLIGLGLLGTTSLGRRRSRC